MSDAIESALAQTHARIEVIVVDDGSTDDTANVARRYHGIRCIHQANRGLAGARNTGASYSSGEYVVFLDADDRLLPSALVIGCDELEKRPDCAFVSGHFRFIDFDGRPQPEWTPEPIGPDPYLHLLMSNYIGMVATVMYRREALRAVGGFRAAPSGAEDYDSYLRITRKSQVCRHNRIVAEYRRYGTAMSDDAFRMLLGTLIALRSQLPYVRGDVAYRAAYREGVKYWRGQFLSPATDQMRRALHARGKRRHAVRALAKGLWVAPVESYMIMRQLSRRERLRL